MFLANTEIRKTYGEAMNVMRKSYYSEDKCSRILKKWQKMALSKKLSYFPEEAEDRVFWKFVANLGKLQKNLDVAYHPDHFFARQTFNCSRCFQLPYNPLG